MGFCLYQSLLDMWYNCNRGFSKYQSLIDNLFTTENQQVMKGRKKADLEASKTKTIEALKRASRLSRAQLTVGPLRYLKEKERNQVLQQLIAEGRVREEISGGGRPGPNTREYISIET